jgi:hypothetical protein
MPSYLFKTPFLLAEKVACYLTEMAIQQLTVPEKLGKTVQKEDNKKCLVSDKYSEISK